LVKAPGTAGGKALCKLYLVVPVPRLIESG